jgi:hypothetical protein
MRVHATATEYKPKFYECLIGARSAQSSLYALNGTPEHGDSIVDCIVTPHILSEWVLERIPPRFTKMRDEAATNSGGVVSGRRVKIMVAVSRV